MLKKIAHIGIAVENLAEGLRVFRDALGLELQESKRLEDIGVTIAFLKIGDIKLELLEPLRADTPIAKFIARQGPGIHHVAVEVDDLDAALEMFKRSGIELIDKQPRPGALGRRIAFVSPKSTGGVLIELEESGRSQSP